MQRAMKFILNSTPLKYSFDPQALLDSTEEWDVDMIRNLFESPMMNNIKTLVMKCKYSDNLDKTLNELFTKEEKSQVNE